MCEHNSDPARSPERLCLPLDQGQIEAASETPRDNKDAQGSAQSLLNTAVVTCWSLAGQLQVTYPATYLSFAGH